MTTLAVRMTRTKHPHWFIARVDGGADDGLKFMLKPEPGEQRRWVKAVKTNATINVPVDAADVETRRNSRTTLASSANVLAHG